MYKEPLFLGKVIGVIPARWGSSRFPGKPLALISGESLISRTYNQTKKVKQFDNIIVATEDERILNHVRNFGGNCVLTSEKCKNGTERVADVVAKFCPEAEIVVNIQGDEPCLKPEIIDQLISEIKTNPLADLITPIAKIKCEDKEKGEAKVNCVFDRNFKALYFSRASIPYTFKKSLGYYYLHLGIYCFKRSLLLKYPLLPESECSLSEDLEQLRILENGFNIYVSLVDQKSISVDYPEDINKVEQFLSCPVNLSL